MLQKMAVYPRAFWILLTCFLFNRIGAALIWPFMALFIRQQTDAPLSTVTLLLSVQAVASLLGTSTISVIMDKYGRRRPMLAGLLVLSGVYLLMSRATEVWQWALLIALYGILQPVFYVGTNAMTADLIPPENRTGAYAVVRTVSNLAIALGPALGGVFIVRDHLLAYYATAFINVVLLVPVGLFVMESLPKIKRDADKPKRGRLESGYGRILRDSPFITFIAVFALLEIGAALVFNLLSVYVNEQYGILEDGYGRLVAINAGMVVLFQYGMTRVTRQYSPFSVMILGTLFYVVGLGGYAFAQTFGQFALCMVVMTIGELMVTPTATAMAANLAQPDMRARYMGLFSLTYTLGTGVGPMLGGLVSEAFFPGAIWLMGSGAAFLATLGFIALARMQIQPAIETV